MKVWKQLILCLIALVIAAGAWIYFFPGARQVLASWGMDWAVAAVAPAEQKNENAGAPGRPASAQTVVTGPVTTETINDKLQAIGTGRAFATVSVNPFASGRLIEFLVDSGARVQKGDVIAKLDADTEEIALERSKVARDDTIAKLDRVKALRTTNTASAVQLTEAEIALRNAELAVSEAQLAFDRRSVLAPIAGVVGILPIEAGNYVTTQSAIATIDDRSSILVDFWVPERFASAVRIGGELTATPLATGKEQFRGTVSAIDNRVDEKSRTLYVRATIANPADSLRAGMSFDITMAFEGDTYPAVSPLAIQWGTDGAFIWTVADGKAKRVPVRIIQRNTGNVLVEAQLSTQDLVVVEGVQAVREGDAVQVAATQPAQPTVAGGS